MCYDFEMFVWICVDMCRMVYIGEPTHGLLMPDRMVGLREAADRLGFHRNTLVKWCKTGKIKATKIGTVWKIPEEEIERVSEEGLLPDDEGGEQVAAARP